MRKRCDREKEEAEDRVGKSRWASLAGTDRCDGVKCRGRKNLKASRKIRWLVGGFGGVSGGPGLGQVLSRRSDCGVVVGWKLPCRE